MSKQQANISLSKAFKDHKSKEKIFYLAKKDKDLIDLFINFERGERVEGVDFSETNIGWGARFIG